MRSDRAIAALSGVAAVVLTALAPPEPGAPLRLLGAGLLGAALAVSLLAPRHPHAPLGAAALVAAGLAAGPAASHPLWSLAAAFPALLFLHMAWHDPRLGWGVGATVGVAAVGALLLLALAALLPRMSPGSVPLLLLFVAVLLLAAGGILALLRHGNDAEGPAPDDAQA